MNIRKLTQLARHPFAVFYTSSTTGDKVHVFEDGEFLYTLSVRINIFRKATPKRAKNLCCSFCLSKKLPGAAALDFLDSDVFDSRKEAEAAADEQLYSIVERLGS